MPTVWLLMLMLASGEIEVHAAPNELACEARAAEEVATDGQSCPLVVAARCVLAERLGGEALAP